jgi:hypothetical protein
MKVIGQDIFIKIEKILLNIISTFFIGIFYFFLFMLCCTPFVGLIYMYTWFELLHIDNQITLYCTLIGIIFSWSFIEKTRKSFYTYLASWLIIGLLLFQNYLEAYYIPVVIIGLAIGYGLYRLGIVDLLSYLSQILPNIYSKKFNNIEFKWLVIFYRCKLKKLNVYLNDGININQAIIINILESSEFFTIYFCDTAKINLIIEKEATLEFFDELVTEKLLLYPDMEILIYGQANEKTVFWLVNFLLQNRFNKVGFLSITSINILIDALKKAKNDKEN